MLLRNQRLAKPFTATRLPGALVDTAWLAAQAGNRDVVVLDVRDDPAKLDRQLTDDGGLKKWQAEARPLVLERRSSFRVSSRPPGYGPNC